MRCPNCKSENPAGKKFCGDCGAALANLCPQCGSDNPAGKRFCGECGTALGSPLSSDVSTATPVETPALAGERRHLTILFCDLVGSVTLAAQVDPEEWRATVAGYQRVAAKAITQLRRRSRALHRRRHNGFLWLSRCSRQ